MFVQIFDRVFNRDDVMRLVLVDVVIIAASDVDLPEPVGPVTRIRPRGRSESCSRIGGRFNSRAVGILFEINRKAAATAPLSR